MSFASAVANLKLNITDFASNMRKASGMMAKFAAFCGQAFCIPKRIFQRCRSVILLISSVCRISLSL